MEVGKMPAQRKTNQSRGLTAAGLIAVTAATLLMMAWAIFPTAAFATVTWTANGLTDDGPLKSEICDENNTPYLFWVFTGDPAQGETAVHLTVNGGAPITMQQQGQGTWQATSAFSDLSTLTASVDGVGGVLAISHGCPGEEETPDLDITKTASTTQVTGGGAVSYTITVENTGGAAARAVVVTDDLD